MTLNQTLFRNNTGAVIQIFYNNNTPAIVDVDVANNANSNPLTGELLNVEVNLVQGRFTCDLFNQLPQLALGAQQNPIVLEVAQVQGNPNQRQLWIRQNNNNLIGAFPLNRVN